MRCDEGGSSLRKKFSRETEWKRDKKKTGGWKEFPVGGKSEVTVIAKGRVAVSG